MARIIMERSFGLGLVFMKSATASMSSLSTPPSFLANSTRARCALLSVKTFFATFGLGLVGASKNFKAPAPGSEAAPAPIAIF